MPRRWTPAGPHFALDWAGSPWTLKVDDPRPGLHGPDASGPLLGLAGLAEVGRRSGSALGGATLMRVEARHDRIEATYAPMGWGQLLVRAAWRPSGDGGVDLEIQAGCRSVGELHGVEVLVLSASSRTPGPPGGRRRIEARDARAAGSTYDGREPDLDGLTTPPVTGRLAPRSVPCEAAVGSRYIEMCHPADVSRRIGRRGSHLITALFGHDLERGVLLRARLRGLFLPESAGTGAAEDAYRRFLDEPLPLGT